MSAKANAKPTLESRDQRWVDDERYLQYLTQRIVPLVLTEKYNVESKIRRHMIRALSAECRRAKTGND